jgi:hypothetical protein
MKHFIVIMLLFTAVCGAWHFTIQVGSKCDTLVSQQLIIGAEPGCSGGFDFGWDVMRPPYPPTGVLAYFFIDDPANPGIDGLLHDFRDEDEVHLLWRIYYYTTLCGVIGDSCILSWEPESLPEGTFRIIPSMEDTGWRAPLSIDWGAAINMRSNSEMPPFWISHMAYISYTSPLSIEETPKPIAISLSAHPNPFNSAVSITVDCRGLINQTPTIEIFDMTGRMVAVIPVGDGSPVPSASGRGDLAPTRFVWQPDASIGSGIYLVRATVGDESVTKRIVYLK